MTKTDFAELKERLCRKQYVDIYVQREHDTAIITELLEIIQSQSEALGFYASDSSWNSVGAFFYNRIDSIDESTIEGLDRHTYFGGKTSRQSLSETTTRLQKLRDGNNGNTTN